MSWIDIAWPMMGAASLTLALIHVLVWWQERTRPAQVLFALTAASIGTLAVFELLMMQSASPGQFATLLRWAHVPVTCLLISMVAFVRVRFGVGRPSLAALVIGTRLVALVANFSTGVNLNFVEIDALQRVSFVGNAVVALPVGTANPWMFVGQASNLLLIAFLVDAIVTLARRPESHPDLRAMAVVGSMAFFVALASVWTALVVIRAVSGPLTVNMPFFAVLLVMSYELGGEVVRAAQLRAQLADSESKLLESEQRMQLAARAAGMGLWTWDVEHRQSWFSESVGQLLGLAPDEAMGDASLLERVHADDRPLLQQALADALSGDGEYACEFRLLREDGHERWTEARGRVDSLPSGAPRYLRGVLLDVHRRREAEERFALVIDDAAMAMLMIDGAGLVTMANDRAEDMFGYTRAELMGSNVDLLVPDAMRAAHEGQRGAFGDEPQIRAMAAGRPLSGRHREGHELPVDIKLTPMLVLDDLFVLASIIDISERLRMEHEAAVQRDELAHLSRVALLGEMSVSLAHELNQPLTAILSNAQAALRFLQREHPDLAEVRESLVHIVENDKRASEVIRRLRAMLRKEPVEHQLLDINDVVADVLRLVHSDILLRRATLVLDLASDLPAVLGDRVQLQQVLINLVFNACDAMKKMHGKRVVTVRTSSAVGGVELVVEDRGPGIRDDQLEHIFTPFMTSKAEGIGLGLPICRTIIDSHRGSLWAANGLRGGAALHVLLPAATSTAETLFAPDGMPDPDDADARD